MEFLDVVQLRVILIVAMLGIAGIMDAKSRRIPDVLWLIFGGIGTILYIWDYPTVTSYHIIAILTSTFVGVAIWRWKIAGLADSFAIIAMTVILPVHYEFVMMPIMILVMAFFIVVICMVLYNVSLNLVEMIRTKTWVFAEFKTESKHKKAFAFLAIHRKRKHEKFVLAAEKVSKIESSSKSFVFLLSKNKMTRDNKITKSKKEIYVQNVPPLITFMFGVAMFLLLPEMLNLFILLN